MRKWMWASIVLTAALACGLYSFATWAGNHPLSVLNYGARLASVVGAGHARVAARHSLPPPNIDDGPHAVVEELSDAEPLQEVSEPIVVENVQPIELYEPPANELPPDLPPPAEETVLPTLVMPPCPDELTPVSHTTPASPKVGPVSDCEIDPNYHHQYPGCPWMGGCQNIPAYVPLAPATRTRTRPAKGKWLTLHALMEQMGLTDMEESEETAPVREDGDSSNLSDIIF
jgi:hypothetical protein